MAQKYDRFYPGQVWLDTNGKRIQAHGGSVMYWEGYYYWYGENKEFTDPAKDIWHWGVRWNPSGRADKPEQILREKCFLPTGSAVRKCWCRPAWQRPPAPR